MWTIWRRNCRRARVASNSWPRRFSCKLSAASRALLRIGAAISHLEVNYQAHLNLDELAQIAHMSKRNFLRSFQSALRISPIAYLVQLRVTRGASLLRRTDLTVTEVAFQVGFRDSNYFARQFHKVLGLTPSQYRKQQARLA